MKAARCLYTLDAAYDYAERDQSHFTVNCSSTLSQEHSKFQSVKHAKLTICGMYKCIHSSVAQSIGYIFKFVPTPKINLVYLTS